MSGGLPELRQLLGVSNLHPGVHVVQLLLMHPQRDQRSRVGQHQHH
jgi:hypothetical protein